MADRAMLSASAKPSHLDLPTVELRDRLASGALRAREVAQAAMDRVRAREPEVQAWVWLDEGHVLAEAERLDALRASGRPVGPLHGLPVGLKDIIDTRGIATANGCTLDEGRVPTEDAWIVRRLKAAGALIAGKTVTTELAFLHPGKTRNPANPAHTPGGSSQGSAAAVAAGMVPLAVGTQTGGSVIRPASYCGVVGYKPSFGMIPRTGILTQSPSLDTVGVFATSVEAAALIADVLCGDDPADRATSPAPAPRLFDTAVAKVPVTPTFALVTDPGLGQTQAADMTGAMEELAARLGEGAFALDLPGVFRESLAVRERINFAEMAKFYYRYERLGWDRLSDETRTAMEAGKAVMARDYIAALDWPVMLNAALDEIFDRCDAIVMPATPGPAPEGLGATGTAAYNAPWTFCGVPVVTLPLFEDTQGMPLGLQVIGRRGNDARLLRTARWLWESLTVGNGGVDHA